MHLLSYANRAGNEGHNDDIQVIVVGSARVEPGHS